MNKIETKQISEIMREIAYAVKGINQDALADIILKFGNISISDLVTELKKFNTDFDYLDKQIQEESHGEVCETCGASTEEEDYGEEWLTIRQYMFKVKMLMSFKKDITANTHRTVYSILINEDAIGKIFYANTNIAFISEEARDYEWGMLKKKLEFYSDIHFL